LGGLRPGEDSLLVSRLVAKLQLLQQIYLLFA